MSVDDICESLQRLRPPCGSAIHLRPP